MKKHLSVFMLMARCTIYKILGLFALMATIEASLFYAVLQHGFTDDNYSLEFAFAQSHIVWVFGLIFLLVTVLLCRTGYETSSKQGYTLMRLSISEKQVFLWQSIYNTICYLLLWMIQVIIVIALCYFYMSKADAAYVSNQTIFLAFYRNGFLHSLLPFDDIIFWVRNIILVSALGICSAHYPMAHRKGTRKQEIFTMVCISIGFFSRPLADYLSCFIIITGALICIGVAIYRVLYEHKEVDYEK